MNNKMTIQENNDTVIVTIESKSLKNIIDAIRIYDKDFSIKEFDKDKKITLDTLDAMLFMFHEHLNHLIDDTTPEFYNDCRDADDVDISDDLDLIIDM